MGWEYEEPTIKKENGPVSESVETHPAYAQIAASRVSGAANLYGSDFNHQHYVTISIHRSELHRGLSRDWPHPREEYIEVALSEAQWAAFVSTMNAGSGIQCTLNHLHGKGIPQIPAAPKRHHQFKTEVDARLERALGKLKELREGIKASKLSGKAQEELLNKLSFAESDLSSNIAFVAAQFGEHIEEVTEHAKIEVNAYVQNTIQRAGLTALGVTSPIAFPSSEKHSEKLIESGSSGDCSKAA